MLSKAPRYRGDISACASSRYQAHFPKWSGKCGLGSRRLEMLNDDRIHGEIRTRLTVVAHTAALGSASSPLHYHLGLRTKPIQVVWKSLWEENYDDRNSIELSIYFLQSTFVRCDVTVLLSIYDVIQSPQIPGDISACASSRYQAHFPKWSGKCGLGSRRLEMLNDDRIHGEIRTRLTVVAHTAALGSAGSPLHYHLGLRTKPIQVVWKSLWEENYDDRNSIELSIYFLQSTFVRCDVTVLLSIYDVIQSPQIPGDISACASSRYQAHFPKWSGKCGLGSRRLEMLNDDRIHGEIRTRLTVVAHTAALGSASSPLHYHLGLRTKPIQVVWKSLWEENYDDRNSIELSIYFLQSTFVRCDVTVLLSIYDVIQSPQIPGGY